jgi:hypothetical protein
LKIQKYPTCLKEAREKKIVEGFQSVSFSVSKKYDNAVVTLAVLPVHVRFHL